MSQPPRRLHCSLTSIFQVVSLPKPPSTNKWLVKETNGALPSSILDPPKHLPISPSPRRLPGNLLINTHAQPLMIVRVQLQTIKASTPATAPPPNPSATRNTVPAILHPTLDPTPVTPRWTLVDTRVVEPVEDSFLPVDSAAVKTLMATNHAAASPQIRWELPSNKTNSRELMLASTMSLDLNYLKIQFRCHTPVPRIHMSHLRTPLVKPIKLCQGFCVLKVYKMFRGDFQEFGGCA